MLLSVEISQFLFSFPFFISSMDHKLFIYYIFWKQDPFVLTDACSGAAAKAQLDFLDCHARLVVYTLLSDKQNCSFGTSANNSLSSKRCNCWTCFLFVFFFCSFRKEGHWFLPEIVRLTSRAKALSYKLRCSSRVVFKYCREMNWGWIPGMFGWCNHKNNGRHIWKDWASFASGALV